MTQSPISDTRTVPMTFNEVGCCWVFRILHSYFDGACWYISVLLRSALVRTAPDTWITVNPRKFGSKTAIRRNLSVRFGRNLILRCVINAQACTSRVSKRAKLNRMNPAERNDQERRECGLVEPIRSVCDVTTLSTSFRSKHQHEPQSNRYSDH